MAVLTTGASFTITRDFRVPRPLVWRAWTQPDQLMRWWGPTEFTSPACSVDFRVGGSFHACMRAPDGSDYWTLGVYEEIVEPERIVYIDSFADRNGNVVPATHYGLGEDFPLETLVTVTLEEIAGGTRMTMTHAGIPAGRTSDDTAKGWSQSFDKMANALRT